MPFVGEIRMFAGNFDPAGWEFCDGRLLQIATNDVLFQLIGTTYGGDGQNDFAVPDLRGRVPIHHINGNVITLGDTGGVESVTLQLQQLPVHSHPQLGSTSPAADTVPTNRVLATSTSDIYVSGPANTPLHPLAISPTGGSQPHENMQPYLCINFIIATAGVFPSAT